MSDIPTVISTSEIKIGSVTLIVHQLDNGQRIIDADSMAAFFEAMSDEGPAFSADELSELVKVIRS